MAIVLFITKSGTPYTGAYTDSKKYSGLANSARLVADMLTLNNIPSVVEIAVDNNDIDRLVTLHKPQYCVIQTYWVVPSKFEVLSRLHPNVTWIIRVHSEIPFWATEGTALEWTFKYLQLPKVIVAPNSVNLYKDLQAITNKSNKLIYLPNFYPISLYRNNSSPNQDLSTWNVGCFGAIRPLKNQLIQAIACINYANIRDRKLRFHINGTRIEQGGDPVLKNIRNLFINSNHELVEHSWMTHTDFLGLVSSLDLGMQVSFTESFNIVAADFISQNVPVVTSAEIPFVAKLFHADCTSSKSILKGIYRAEVLGQKGVFLNKYLLQDFSSRSQKIWLDELEVLYVE